METERLYHYDATLREFDAVLTGWAEDGAALLNRTAFYPESGGQDCDTGLLGHTATGVLGAFRVTGVEDRDGLIAHRLEGDARASFSLGQTVHGQIHWPRRYSLMQHHTGQHLLSAVALQLHGWETVSVHIGIHNATVEFAIPTAESAALAVLEQRVNEEIVAAHPVHAAVYAPGEAPTLRKAVAREGPLRVVTIETLDQSACGGTHVASSAHIGCLLLGATERIRKNLRVEFACGLRAVERASTQRDLLMRAASVLQCHPSQLPALLAQQRDELLRIGKRETILTRQLATWQGRDSRAALSLDADGYCVAVSWIAENPADAQRAFAAAFCEAPGGVLLLANRSSGSFLLATNPESGIQANVWLNGVAAGLGARGGGSSTMVSGRIPNLEALDALAATLPGGNPHWLTLAS